MTPVELNFELSSPVFRDPARRDEAMGGIAKVFGYLSDDWAMRQSDVEYEGPDGVVKVRNIIVKMIVKPDVELGQMVYAMAAMLGEDCIAVYYPVAYCGRLIGPASEKWGAFNPEFFKRF